ncbi:RHS repeat-associated core domain-containing protein [Aureispira sp. CCB-QB1]|uniref:RHS repeat-associated core domain-containing protein n=1 Tax=Aureispira sp. CCB-QB1 TaxID=1313421 RepID=UPI0018CC35F5|nr:RHS repeat-associated core domain-containing protein [Aureispira sp. CCB-QB1]
MTTQVSDRKAGTLLTNDIKANVLSYQQYYPFGWEMPGRKYNSGNYRFGFNGMEKDKEISNGNYTTHFRALDTRIGRWWSVDPVTHAHLSPYNSMDDNPILGVDPVGGNTESTHIDKLGNVIHEYDDGDNGVYVHENGTTRADIDLQRNGGLNPGGDGNYIGQLGGSLDLGKYGIYQNKLVESANIALSENFSTEQWITNVKGDGIWDLKANCSTIWGVAWAYDENDWSGTGKKTQFVTPKLTFEDASDFGNYHAGFTGSMTGIPTSIQTIGAGLIEQYKDLKAGEIMQMIDQYTQNWNFYLGEPPAFMDEVDDHYWNTQGMSDALFLKEKLKLSSTNPLGVIKKE